MCGFVAVILDPPQRVPEARDIARMRDLLVHRGPDMDGLKLGAGFGLGFRRLSILDLTPEANQPMSDEADLVHLVFNGEIYNHEALRDRLRALGHSFRTHGDTEVLLRAYMQWGAACVQEFEGMYAFVVVDERKHQVCFARDHVGIKPLYVARISGRQGGPGWLFASEIKAFAGWPGFEMAFDPDSLPELLAFRATAGERTSVRGVRRVLPGHTGLIASDCPESPVMTRFFDARDAWQPAGTPGSLLQASVELEALLTQSVHAELRSDVPVGTQLSSGIDSGVVTALARRASSQPLDAFTVWFDGDAPDERPGARAVADRYGVRLNEIPVRRADFADVMPELAWHMDEPIDHPNSVGVHALCRQAHGQVTVLLSGQGADELLGGYERYRTATVTHALSRRVPRALRAAVRHLPPGRTYGRGESLERAARMEPEETLLLSSAYVDPALLRVLGVAGDPVGDFRRTALARSPGTPLERLLFYDLDTYLASLLQRDDKMSMAASIENRVPYLERRVVEACVRIHPTHKRVDRDGKRVLRAVAGRLLDAPAVPTGRKIGFAAPVASWLQLPGLAERLEGFGRGQGRITSLVSAELVAFARKGLGQGHRQATELAWMLMTLDHHLDALASAASRAAAVPASRGLQ